MHVCEFLWIFLPHHVAMDFEPLLGQVRKAFSITRGGDACWLFRAVRAFIVDGQVCVLTSECNARDCNLVFSSYVREGFFKGCMLRPLRRSQKLCHTHPCKWSVANFVVQVRESDHRKIVSETAYASSIGHRARCCQRPTWTTSMSACTSDDCSTASTDH